VERDDGDGLETEKKRERVTYCGGSCRWRCTMVVARGGASSCWLMAACGGGGDGGRERELCVKSEERAVKTEECFKVFVFFVFFFLN
jgi:hypothetical protein